MWCHGQAVSAASLLSFRPHSTLLRPFALLKVAHVLFLFVDTCEMFVSFAYSEIV